SKQLRAGLLLDTREGLLQGGSRGPAIVPGKPRESLLIEAIRHESRDAHLVMPSKKPKLANEIIANFEQWIKMGAPDPRSGKSVAKLPAWGDASPADHWAFQKIKNLPIPNVDDVLSFVRSPIDHFVLAKLAEHNLTPSPPVDRH